MLSWVERAMAEVTPSTISAYHPLRKIFWLPANIWLEQIICDPSMPRYRWWRHRRAFWAAAADSFSAAGQALLQRTGRFRTLARVPERSKYRKAACRPDAKWSAAADRPTSPHLNLNSSPVRFSAVSNGHLRDPVDSFSTYQFLLARITHVV